jgi:type IV pilus assembly protein PilW
VRQAGFPGAGRKDKFPTTATGIVGADVAASDTLTVMLKDSVDCEGATIASGMVTNRFFVNADKQLICRGASSAGIVLAEDIQDFQVRYGIDTAAVASGERAANVSAILAAPSAAQFEKVVSVRVCLLVASRDDKVLPSAQPYTDCAGASVTPSDTKLRQRFISTTLLRNRVS